MELRDLAIQVLFAETLEDKLRSPRVITDESPGSAVRAPAEPGRPADLKFKSSGTRRSDFPGLRRLEQEKERGRLLHFFANHELLATELMALVLLKFPEAPPAFRQDVLRTLRDEQRHTRLYVKRMEACGIHFGELPVSGFFWKTVSGMESPLDYVAGLSLTFEQANLDYCRHFAGGFSEVGDGATARLLEGIYRDEIFHVAYGLRWFRRWKEPGCSDWEAFCRHLRLPLSPNRAKGVGYNAEGRRAAGLDAEFIEELKVYTQSKGRTPGVFVFNPFAESELGAGAGFQPVRAQAILRDDLENLPQFLCRQDDIVLVERRPSAAFLKTIQEAGFGLPEFVKLNKGRLDSDHAVGRRKLAGLHPWAWAPSSVNLMQPLFSQVTGESSVREADFPREWAPLYSKGWSASFLGRLLGEISEEDEEWLCPVEAVGTEAGSFEEAVAAIAGIRGRGHHKVVLKRVFGLAGHDMIRLWEPEITGAQRQWIRGALGKGQRLVVEPWLDRKVDFSLSLEMRADDLKLKGYTRLFNEEGGQFRAVLAGPDHARKLPPALMELFRSQPLVLRRVHAFYDLVVQELCAELRRRSYDGPLGVDALAYQAQDGRVRIKPIVEINPRYTMGRVMVELMKQVSPGRWGSLTLVRGSRLERGGRGGCAAYASQWAVHEPVRLAGKPAGKISQGVLCLNDPALAREYLAVLRVDRSRRAVEP